MDDCPSDGEERENRELCPKNKSCFVHALDLSPYKGEQNISKDLEDNPTKKVHFSSPSVVYHEYSVSQETSTQSLFDSCESVSAGSAGVCENVQLNYDAQIGEAKHDMDIAMNEAEGMDDACEGENQLDANSETNRDERDKATVCQYILDEMIVNVCCHDRECEDMCDLRNKNTDFSAGEEIISPAAKCTHISHASEDHMSQSTATQHLTNVNCTLDDISVKYQFHLSQEDAIIISSPVLQLENESDLQLDGTSKQDQLNSSVVESIEKVNSCTPQQADTSSMHKVSLNRNESGTEDIKLHGTKPDVSSGKEKSNDVDEQSYKLSDEQCNTGKCDGDNLQESIDELEPASSQTNTSIEAKAKSSEKNEAQIEITENCELASSTSATYRETSDPVAAVKECECQRTSIELHDNISEGESVGIEMEISVPLTNSETLDGHAATVDSRKRNYEDPDEEDNASPQKQSRLFPPKALELIAREKLPFVSAMETEMAENVNETFDGTGPHPVNSALTDIELESKVHLQKNIENNAISFDTIAIEQETENSKGKPNPDVIITNSFTNEASEILHCSGSSDIQLGYCDKIQDDAVVQDINAAVEGQVALVDNSDNELPHCVLDNTISLDEQALLYEDSDGDYDQHTKSTRCEAVLSSNHLKEDGVDQYHDKLGDEPDDQHTEKSIDSHDAHDQESFEDTCNFSPRFVSAYEYHSQCSQQSSQGFQFGSDHDEQLSCSEKSAQSQTVAASAHDEAELEQMVPANGEDEDTNISMYNESFSKDKDMKLYSCDLSMCGTAGEPLCKHLEEVPKKSSDAVPLKGQVPHEKCFKWKCAPSCDLDDVVSLPSNTEEAQASRILPLQTCE